MAINLKTISQLPEITNGKDLKDSSYIGVDVPAAWAMSSNSQIVPIYTSKKISKSTFGDAMTMQISDYYDRVHHISSGMNVGELYSEFYQFKDGSFTVDGNTTFTNAPKIDETISDYYSTENDQQKKAVNLETLRQYSGSAVSPAIGNDFGFVTHLSSYGKEADPNKKDVYYNLYRINEEDNTTNGFYNWGLTPDIKNVSEHEYVFRIEPNKKESNVWTAPATGIFTCYGWLDEIQTEKVSNESRWVALLGLKQFADNDERWVILQLQPFIPNNFLSYVGFNFPVQAGMHLKIVTGFTTGSNSDKYFKSQSSVANMVPNGFLGGIYTNLSMGNDSSIIYENIDIDEIWNDLSARVNALEISANNNLTTDNSQQEQIDELSGRDYGVGLSALSGISVILSNEISSLENRIEQKLSTKVDYFDTLSTDALSGARIFLGLLSSLNVDTTPQNYLFNNSPAQKITWNWEKSVLWNMDNATAQRHYVAPPAYNDIISENAPREAGEQGVIAEAYVVRPGIDRGAVFTDGIYYYYRVSQNCTVRITLGEDPTNHCGDYTFCILLCSTDNRQAKDADGILLVDNGDLGSYHRQHNSITVPVVKDSVLVFGACLRERLPNVSEDNPYCWFNSDGGAEPDHRNINTLGSGGFRSMFNATWEKSSVPAEYNTYTKEGKLEKAHKYTYRINVDGSNAGNLFSTSGDTNKYNLATTNFGLLATVVEMP